MSTATRLVGRDAELQEVKRALDSDAAVVTIVGPPGVGKSALGRAVLPQEAVRCELSTATDATTFLRKLGQAARVETEGDTQAALLAALRSSERLVFLDGFDALVGSCRNLLGDVVDSLPAVRWLITSRERTGLEGETVVALGPLQLEAALELIDAEGDNDRSTLEQLVRRLDCNPLAIQLASARLRTFTAHDLLQRLDQRFALLRSQRDALSLGDAISLSWELLDSSERQCLAQCTTFPAAFDIDAAEGVLQLDPELWVMDVVESLVEKSLLVRLAGGRLDLYESIRAFVQGQNASELAIVEQRHAAYYLSLGEGWNGGSWTAEQLDRSVCEEPHLRAIIERFEHRDPVVAAKAAVMWNKLLRHRGTSAVHFEVLDRGVAAAREADCGPLLARLLQARAELGAVSGQLIRAGEDAQESAEVAGANDLPRVRLLAEVQRAEVERRTGYAQAALARIDALLAAEGTLSTELLRYAEAHRAACLVEVGELDTARKVAMHLPAAPKDADAADEYQALKRLAYAHYYLGNFEEQLRLNEEALALAKRVGDRRRTARARQGLGDAAFARGDFDAARSAYLEALDEHRELGNEHLCGVLLGNLGAAEHRIDETDAAAKHYVEALTLHRRSGARPYEAVVEFALGALEHAQGHYDDASFHYAHAEELFTDLGQPDDVLATRVCSAWLHIARGAQARALSALEFDDLDESWSAVFERTRAIIVPDTTWRTDDPSGPELPARLARTLGAHLRGEPLDDDLRGTLQGGLLLDLLRGATATAAPSSKPDLIVAEGAEWFQTGAGEPVNLRRRKAHRRILEELTVRHLQRPVPALDVYDAYDLGWPGEQIEPEAAAERVYWVVGVLRKLGLDQLLLTSDEGYYLATSADVRRG